MDVGKVLFLIFLVASAMICGTTFAVVTTISNRAPIQAQVVNQDTSQDIDTSETANSELAPSSPSGRVQSTSEEPEKTSVLSPDESREVEKMLAELGYAKPTLTESLDAFRKQQVIASSNSYLDDATLQSIINQLSLSKARAF